MRYFDGKIEDADEIVIYDIMMEFILKSALDLLVEKDWNVKEAAETITGKEWQKEAVDKVLEFTFESKDEDVYNYKDFYNYIEEESTKWLNTVREVFEEKDHAKSELERLELLSKSTIENIGNPSEMKKSVIAVPCLWNYGPLSSSPAALFVTSILGYVVDLDVGITKGLNGVNPKLFGKLVEIWDNAVKNLHPFQRGPTHQGTKHCSQILDSLYSLYDKCPAIQGTDGLDSTRPEKRAMMSIAAAIHDFGKGDLLADPPPAPDYHARNCAKLIAKERAIFKLNGIHNSCIDLIEKMVEMHNPEDQMQKIGVLGDIYVEDTGLGIGSQQAKTANLCALFHLADVMDTTKHRVSEPAFKILEHLHRGDSGFYSIEKLVNARRGIINCKVKKGPPCCIEVKVSSIPSFAIAAKTRINKENEDLETTGAKKILAKNNWPEKLTVA